MAGSGSTNKKQGVSGKSLDPGQTVKLPKTEKDFRCAMMSYTSKNSFLIFFFP